MVVHSVFIVISAKKSIVFLIQLIKTGFANVVLDSFGMVLYARIALIIARFVKMLKAVINACGT